MRIEKALAVRAWGGYYNDDLAAIRHGARSDGLFYVGPPVTPGFASIRQPAEAVSVVLVLDSGQCVAGDALSVAYSGAGGRSTRFRHEFQLDAMQDVCAALAGQSVTGFLDMCGWLEGQEFGDSRLNRTAAFYAVSQALLQAVALAQRRTGAEVLAAELDVQVSQTLIPINVQCGEDRRAGVDKAIAHRADALPHGLINSLDVLGNDGSRLVEYVSWVIERIKTFGAADYRPELHVDAYGLLGTIFENDARRIAGYIAGLAEQASPYVLCLETPVLMDSRAAQIDCFGAIRTELRRLGSTAQIIVDEWADDLEDIGAFVQAGVTDMINVKTPDLGAISNAARAVLLCWSGGVRPILGGSCTDTDQSARMVCQVALATRPAWILARPGMGIDEGFQIVHNEMRRTLAIIEATAA